MTQLEDRIDYVDADTEDKLYEAMRDKFWYPVAYSDDLTDTLQDREEAAWRRQRS